jgi:salicylate hydroxylase
MVVQGIEKPSLWALQSVRPLTSYASGRVIIIGDAVSRVQLISIALNADSVNMVQAHGMPPHLGAGAGQAIEVHFHYLMRCRRVNLSLHRTPTY